MDKQDQEHLDAIRARCEAATPKPWIAGEPTVDEWYWCASDIDGPDGRSLAAVRADEPYNADFIAHAREDIPYLLAQLDAARAEIAKLRERPFVDPEHEYSKGDLVWIPSYVEMINKDPAHPPIGCLLKQVYGGPMHLRFFDPDGIMPRADLPAYAGGER